MSVIEIIGGAMVLVASLLIIVICLLQDQKQQQNMTSALGGSSNESFYDKHASGRTKEAQLIKATRVSAIIFFVVTLIVNIVHVFFK